MEWITENWETLLMAWLALIGFMQIVVRITPTNRDDMILGKIAGLSQGLRNLLTGAKPLGSKDLK